MAVYNTMQKLFVASRSKINITEKGFCKFKISSGSLKFNNHMINFVLCKPIFIDNCWKIGVEIPKCKLKIYLDTMLLYSSTKHENIQVTNTISILYFIYAVHPMFTGSLRLWCRPIYSL